jgi:hypothetical protein
MVRKEREMGIQWKHRFQFYVDHASDEIRKIKKKNTEAVLDARNQIGLGVKTGKTKYIFVCATRMQNKTTIAI